jgi:hypothetical protein
MFYVFVLIVLLVAAAGALLFWASPKPPHEQRHRPRHGARGPRALPGPERAAAGDCTAISGCLGGPGECLRTPSTWAGSSRRTARALLPALLELLGRTETAAAVLAWRIEPEPFLVEVGVLAHAMGVEQADRGEVAATARAEVHGTPWKGA